MNFNDMYPSKYLKKEDVPTPRTVTIKSVGRSLVGGEENGEEKNVIFFQEIKEMVLNKGNGFVLFEAFGEPGNWPGKQVEVYCDPSVMFGGKRVGGLRLRPVAQSSQQPALDVWNIEQALLHAEKAGITKDEVRALVAAGGHAGWNPVRDTPTLRAKIEAKMNSGEEIPF